MDHLMTCSSYKSDPEKDWSDISDVRNNTIKKVAKAVQKRVKERQNIMHKEEASQTQVPDSIALD